MIPEIHMWCYNVKNIKTQNTQFPIGGNSWSSWSWYLVTCPVNCPRNKDSKKVCVVRMAKSHKGTQYSIIAHLKDIPECLDYSDGDHDWLKTFTVNWTVPMYSKNLLKLIVICEEVMLLNLYDWASMHANHGGGWGGTLNLH